MSGLSAWKLPIPLWQSVLEALRCLRSLGSVKAARTRLRNLAAFAKGGYVIG